MIESLWEKKPNIIQCPVFMEDANSPISVYEGEFLLKGTNTEVTIKGEIFYSWLPSSGTKFKGSLYSSWPVVLDMFEHDQLVDLIVDNMVFVKCFLTRIAGSSLENDIHQIEGVMSQRAVFGDVTVSVEKIRFCVPNMRDIYGRSVMTEDRMRSASNRLSVEDNKHIINLDKDIDFAEREKILKEKGGYLILASGELIPKSGQIDLEEGKRVLHSFGIFLSFYSGKRISPVLLHGLFEEQTLWCDYASYTSDMFKAAVSWASHDSTFRMDELWKAFSSL